MDIQFEDYRLTSFYRSSVDSVNNLLSLVNLDIASSNRTPPMLQRVRPEIKALIYVSMHSTVEGMLKLASELYSEAFISLEIDNSRRPANMFQLIAFKEEIRTKNNSDNDSFHKSSWFNKLDLENIEDLVPREHFNDSQFIWEKITQLASKNPTFHDPGFTGFFRMESIDAYLKYFGIKRSQVFFSGLNNFDQTWDEIRTFRNEVAHGRKALKELGRDYGNNIVEKHVTEWKIFVESLYSRLVERGNKLSCYYQTE